MHPPMDSPNRQIIDLIKQDSFDLTDDILL
jgi:hypothetical protein